MKRFSFISSIFWLVCGMGLVLALGLAMTGCSSSAEAADPTLAAAPVTPSVEPSVTLRGFITYQGMPTPTSMLYIISPERWYSLEVPSASPSSSFEIKVAPGAYQLVAYPTGSETQPVRPAAAYTTGSGIAILTVTASQVVENLHVQNINSDNCMTYAFPASPDGRFPALAETCSQLPTEVAPATLRGTITFQAPPTPATILYIFNPDHMYPLDVPGGSPAATFEMKVAPGTYQLMAFPAGSESLANRPAAAYSSGSGLGSLTVSSGQVLEGIKVQNINPDRCVQYPFPASPDGRFPAIQETCSALPPEPTTGTVRGTITYPGPPTPTSMLYFISSERYYVMEVPGGSPSSSFELQVLPGTYQVVAFPSGSEALANRPAAAYSTGSGLGTLTVTAGQVLDGIRVQNINSDRCVNYAFPASPDGRFPPIEENCSTAASDPTPATVRGFITYQAPPTPSSMLYFISPERWYVLEVPGGDPSSSFELAVLPGSYQVIAFPSDNGSGSGRGSAAYSTGSGIGLLTVTAGQVLESIHVQNINPDQCIKYAFPASPDGRFPALDSDCS
jgi:hypothetical protein